MLFDLVKHTNYLYHGRAIIALERNSLCLGASMSKMGAPFGLQRNHYILHDKHDFANKKRHAATSACQSMITVIWL